jgi:exonuclease SbcC
MKPLHLAFEAFGPYAARQDLPFDDLDSLFVIAGDTGAGKTTIFDAMSWALYGKPLGTRTTTSVRHLQAAPTQPTWVRFRFKNGDATWEVYRAGEYQRPKKSGTGTTKEEGVVTLARVLPDGSLDPHREKDLDTYLTKQVMRLTHEEFSKVLVLPQGEFQRFLEQGSNERAALLMKLFPTEEHTSLLALARDKAKEAADAIRAHKIQLDLVLKEFNPSTVDATRATARAEVEDAKLAAEKADAARIEAASALQSARQRADDHAALARTRATLAELKTEAPAIANARAEVAASHRAGRVKSERDERARVAGQLAQAEADKHSAREAVEVAQRQVEALREAHDRREVDEAALQVVQKQNVERVERVKVLEQLVTAERDCDEAGRAVARARAAVPDAEQRLGNANAALEALAQHDDALLTLTPQLERAQERAGAARALESIVNQIEAWEQTHAPAAEVARERHATRVAKASAEVDVAERSLKEAQERIEAAAASLLAEHLAEGDACPVCGSTSHPNKAVADAVEGDARARRDAAEAALRACRSALQTARDAQSGDTSNFALLEKQAGEARGGLLQAGFTDVAAWRHELAERQRALAGLQEEAATHRARLARRTEIQREVSEAKSALDNLGTKVTGFETTLARLVGGRDALRERVGGLDVPADRALVTAKADMDAATRAEKVEAARLQKLRSDWSTATQALATTSERVHTTEDSIRRFGAELVEARRKLEDALAKEGFATEGAAEDATRSAAEEAVLAERIARWDRAFASASASEQDLAVRVGDAPAPDLTALQTALDTATEARREALEVGEKANKRLSNLEDWARRYDEYMTAIGSAEADSAVITQLAKDLSGENPLKIDLPTWVLGGWLDRVLVSASTYFRTLSGGQYAFALRTEAQGRAKKAGLDLDVVDAHMGGLRDVRTLSGGEKFIASLSLALGLAEVVQARAGGVRIDTLFIDEGFGSLDPTVLDRALGVLEELGAHRSVGLISHVDAVKRAVPCHIKVARGANGSRLTPPSSSRQV